MDSNNQDHLNGELLNQISDELFIQISSNNSGPLTKCLRCRLDELPRHTCKELVEKKLDGCAPLFIACREGKLQIVEYLITVCKADIEQRGILTTLDEEGFVLNEVLNVTPLCCACAADDLEIVNCLLRHGCDVNALSGNGSTALRLACSRKFIEIVYCLIENGADIQKKNFNGVTCLMNSTESKSLCSYLISKGADVNARDLDDKTALHYAVERGSLETIQLLLDHGVDPCAKTRFGHDAVQLACIVGLFEKAEYLLSRIIYSTEKWADAVELMGSMLIHFNYHMDDVVLCLRTATEGRLGGDNNIQKRPQIPPQPAFGNAVEFTTLAELETLDMDALRTQGSLIQMRILGINHESTLDRLMEHGALNNEIGRYQECIDIWMLTLQERIQKHTILHFETSDTARAIVRLLLNLLESEHRSMPRFEDVYAMFQLLISTIIEGQQLINIRPVDRKHQLNYNVIIQCLMHLMHLLLSVVVSKDEDKLIKSSVRRLVQNNIACALNDETLLHLSVSNMSVFDSEYVATGTTARRIFPNEQVTRLLLGCGADVNAYDAAKTTPLLLACFQFNYEKTVVRTLIEHGAHLDLPNILGERPVTVLASNPSNDIRLGSHISLQCLCANVITEFGIAIPNQFRRVVADFIQAHMARPF